MDDIQGMDSDGSESAELLELFFNDSENLEANPSLLEPTYFDSQSDDDGPFKEIDDEKNKQGYTAYRNWMKTKYPKLSALTQQQHQRCLRVLFSRNPNVAEKQYFKQPIRDDFKVFKKVQETYLAEQQEFIEWAKYHALKRTRVNVPQLVEDIYKAEYIMKAVQMKTFPKNYRMVSDKFVDNSQCPFDMVRGKVLIEVDISRLPQLENPMILRKMFSLLNTPMAFIKPNMNFVCNKHPCHFTLPNRSMPTILPLTKIHDRLAQYAIDNGAHYIASEQGLKCLVESDRTWTVAVSNCEVKAKGGEKRKVVVFGDEVILEKEYAHMRTYRAFKLLLKGSLITRYFIDSKQPMEGIDDPFSPDYEPKPSTSYEREPGDFDDEVMPSIAEEDLPDSEWGSDDSNEDVRGGKGNIEDDEYEIDNDEEIDSDLEEEELPLYQRSDRASGRFNFIDLGGFEIKKPKNTEAAALEVEKALEDKKEDNFETNMDELADKFRSLTLKDVDTVRKRCTCKETPYEEPIPRSYTKWRLRNSHSNKKLDVIVHCAHELRNNKGEVVLEPIPEYQIELGASQLTEEKVKSLTLALTLRKNASLILARVDHLVGFVVRLDTVTREEFIKEHGDKMAEVRRVIAETLCLLNMSKAGRYLLHHQAGADAMVLYDTDRFFGLKWKVDFEAGFKIQLDEVFGLNVPLMTPLLLPMHMDNKILPCAFSPYYKHLSREGRKIHAKQKQEKAANAGQKRKGKGKKSKHPRGK